MNDSLPTLPVKSPVRINTLFDYSARLLGETSEARMSRFKGSVILVVNIATHCERTTKELNQLNDLVYKYGNRIAVLAFPCNQFGHQVSSGNEMETWGLSIESPMVHNMGHSIIALERGQDHCIRSA